jgi:hypothetical protein
MTGQRLRAATFRLKKRHVWIAHKWLMRSARIWATLLLVLVYPQAAHRISREALPRLNHRMVKTNQPLDDFPIISERCTEIPEMDAVTVVMGGRSFDEDLLDDLEPPIFLLNWPSRVEREGVFYATADTRHAKRYADQGMFPIICFEVWWTELNGTSRTGWSLGDVDRLTDGSPIQRIAIRYGAQVRSAPPLGSGLACIAGLSKFARRLDVYGWDYYFRSSPASMGLWQVLWTMFTSISSVEGSFLNLHYAQRLSESTELRLHGLLGNLGRHERLRGSLDTLFYRG